MKLIFSLLGAAVVFALYVRFVPSKNEVWHRPPDEISTNPEGSYRTDLEGVAFSQLHTIIIATPRTRILAGDPAAQFMTYVTRSKVWGFPDYTTVEQRGSQLTIVGRSRFGRKDFGVNKDRIKGWIAAMEEARG